MQRIVDKRHNTEYIPYFPPTRAPLAPSAEPQTCVCVCVCVTAVCLDLPWLFSRLLARPVTAKLASELAPEGAYLQRAFFSQASLGPARLSILPGISR